MGNERVPVLDHGYILLEGVLGDDLMVVNRARGSFGRRSTKITEADRRLIRTLERGTELWTGERIPHWSPFAHPKIALEVRVPHVVYDHWYKTVVDSLYAEDMHAWNAESFRYVTRDIEFYVPPVWFQQSENNKQAAAGPMSDTASAEATAELQELQRATLEVYRKWLSRGMAGQQARFFLPYETLYHTFGWTASLWTVVRFLKERLPDDAQWETTQFAKALEGLVRPLFPESFAALLPERKAEA